MKQNPKYVMRITGDDSEDVDQLSNFIDPESKYPVIVTTSRLLSTGVDAQTCRLIVLGREVRSMTESKQIVGRGTREHEDTKMSELRSLGDGTRVRCMSPRLRADSRHANGRVQHGSRLLARTRHMGTWSPLDESNL